MLRSLPRTTSLAIVATGLSVQIADAQQAMTANAVADALVATWGAAIGSATYESAIAQGADIVVSNFHASGRFDLVITKITVTDPKALDNGGLLASRMELDTVSAHGTMPRDEWVARCEAISVTRAYALPMGAARIRPQSGEHYSVSTKGLAFGMHPFDPPTLVASTEVETDFSDDVDRFDWKTEGITVPPSPSELQNGLAGLGYTQSLTGRFGISATYAVPSGVLSPARFSFTVDGMGTVSFQATLVGFDGAQPFDRAISGAELTQALANVALASATLRFENAGVVERALDLAARQAPNKPRDTIIAEAASAIGRQIGTFLPPTYAAHVEADAAINAFLKDPRSLQLRSAPSEPVRLSPAGANLYESLAIHVEANQ